MICYTLYHTVTAPPSHSMVQFGQFSRSVTSNSLRPHEPQCTRPPCPSPTPRVQPNPCPSSRWCHPTISSSVVPFSSCPQSFPASGSFPTLYGKQLKIRDGIHFHLQIHHGDKHQATYSKCSIINFQYWLIKGHSRMKAYSFLGARKAHWRLKMQLTQSLLGTDP